MESKPAGCPYCAKQLARSDSLRRHISTFHPGHIIPYSHLTPQYDQNSGEEEAGDEVPETPEKTRKDCMYFYPIAEEAWSNTYDKWKKTLDKLKESDENLTDEDAIEEADGKMYGKHEKAFFEVYKDYIIKALNLRKSSLHKKVLQHAVTLHKRDVPPEVASSVVIKKYKDDIDAIRFVRHAGNTEDCDEEEESSGESSGESTNADDSDHESVEQGDTSDSSEEDPPEKRRKLDF